MFKYTKMLECDNLLDTFKYKIVVILGIFSLFFFLVSCGVSESVKAKTDEGSSMKKVSGFLVDYKKMTVTNIGNKLYPLSYGIEFDRLKTEEDADGPLSNVTYTVRQRKGEGEWKVNDEFREEKMTNKGVSYITSLASDKKVAESLKKEYGSTYEFQIIASNGENFSTFSEEVKFVSFPDLVPVAAMTVITNDKQLDISWEGPGSEYSDGGSTVVGYAVALVISRNGPPPSPLATPVETRFVQAGQDRQVSISNLYNNVSYYLTIMPGSMPGSEQLSLMNGIEAIYGPFSSINTKPSEEKAGIELSLKGIFGTYLKGVPGPHVPSNSVDGSFPPDVPTGVTLAEDSNNPATAISVSWTAPSDVGRDIGGNTNSISNYIVEWSTDKTFPVDENTKREESTTNSYTITGLNAETGYFVRVKTVTATLEGVFSVPAFFRTTAATQTK